MSARTVEFVALIHFIGSVTTALAEMRGYVFGLFALADRSENSAAFFAEVTSH